MAEKGKQTGKTTVRRIKATDDSPKKTVKKKPPNQHALSKSLKQIQACATHLLVISREHGLS